MPRLAGVDAELSRAELDKYAAPLLLLHGLWTTPSMWRPAASYLAHRGWNSYALGWRAAARTWNELLTSAQTAADALERPVVIGHDLGGLAAMKLERVRAAVALAPLASGPAAPPHPLSRSWTARLARWRGAELLPSGAEARRVLGLAREKLVPESSAWWAELARIEMTAANDRAPRLVVAGEQDPCLPRAAAEALARGFGAELRFYIDAAHDLPYGPRWQSVVGDVHRWLVRRLGDEVVLLRGDEDLRDD